MKTLKVLLVSAFALVALSSSAQQAIGLRFGGGSASGADISYQRAMSDANRLQLDLGIDIDGDYTNFGLTGTYQWVFDLADVTDGLQWFVGPGAQLGFWDYDYEYNGVDYGNNGSYFGIGGILGIDYTFTEVPIQLSLDTRPMYQVIDGEGDAYWGIALGVRYAF